MDFIFSYLLLGGLALLAFVGFWGFVIYLGIKFFRSDNGMSNEQKIGVVTGLMRARSGMGGSSELGPNATEARGTLINAGIDPDKPY